MATTGSERGLTLRCPGRFLAAADRLVDLVPRLRGDRPTADAARRAWSGAWMDAEAYQLLHASRTVTGIVERRARRAPESSLTKIFWSELDVRLHETALELLGPPSATTLDAVDGARG